MSSEWYKIFNRLRVYKDLEGFKGEESNAEICLLPFQKAKSWSIKRSSSLCSWKYHKSSLPRNRVTPATGKESKGKGGNCHDSEKQLLPFCQISVCSLAIPIPRIEVVRKREMRSLLSSFSVVNWSKLRQYFLLVMHPVQTKLAVVSLFRHKAAIQGGCYWGGELSVVFGTTHMFFSSLENVSSCFASQTPVP